MRRPLVVLVLALALGAAPARGAAPEAPASREAGDDPARPLGFDEAVQRALARNPSAVVALEEVRRAQALVRQARAGSLPTLSVAGTYTRLDGDRTMGVAGTDSYRVIAGANQLAASLSLSVPLVNAQRWVGWSHAKDNVDVSRLSAKEVRRQVAVATARAYLAVVAQKRVLDVNERALATAKAHYDYALARRKGGVGNRIDEVRANLEVSTSAANVQAAESALVKAREALGVLVGAEVAIDTRDEPLLPDAGPVPEALDQAERQRADVLLARARQRAAERVLSHSWTDFMPTLAGSFQPFFQDPPSLVLPRTGWQATLSLSWTLYDGGLRYGQRRERAALVAEANAALSGALRQARADVRAAAAAVRRADAALAAARTSARLSHEALDLATLAYRAGATTNLEVIDAERRARDADTTAAISEDTARQARLDLLAATGKFP